MKTSEIGKKMLYLYGVVAVIYILLAIPALSMIKNKVSIDQKNQWNWGMIILCIQILHFCLSFKIVGPTELGAVLLFGKPIFQIHAGLAFVPFLICQIMREDGTTIKKQFPAEPELVDKSGDDTKPVRPGFVKPIRVATVSYNMLSDDMKKKIKGDTNDPLNKMLVVEPSVVVRFQIIDYLLFLKNIGSMEKAVSQMRDTVDSVLNIEFPKRTPSLLVQDKDTINNEILNRVEILVGDPDNKIAVAKKRKSWGIDVMDAQIAELDLSKGIHTSIRDIVNSELKKTATITQAEGEKEKKTLEGEGEKEFATRKGAGDASARLAFLEAETKGLQGIADVAKTEAGKLAILTKATEQGLKGSQYSIIPDGSGSIVAGIMETLKKTGSRNTSSDDKSENASDPKTDLLFQEFLKKKMAEDKTKIDKNKKGGKK